MVNARAVSRRATTQRTSGRGGAVGTLGLTDKPSDYRAYQVQLTINVGRPDESHLGTVTLWPQWGQGTTPNGLWRDYAGLQAYLMDDTQAATLWPTSAAALTAAGVTGPYWLLIGYEFSGWVALRQGNELFPPGNPARWQQFDINPGISLNGATDRIDGIQWGNAVINTP